MGCCGIIICGFFMGVDQEKVAGKYLCNIEIITIVSGGSRGRDPRIGRSMHLNGDL